MGLSILVAVLLLVLCPVVGAHAGALVTLGVSTPLPAGVPRVFDCDTDGLCQLAGLPQQSPPALVQATPSGPSPLPSLWMPGANEAQRCYFLAPKDSTKFQLVKEGPAAKGPTLKVHVVPEGVQVDTRFFSVFHSKAAGGLPVKIAIGGQDVGEFHFFDRVFDKQLGGFELLNDHEAKLHVTLAHDKCCAVVDVEARYLSSQGRAPEGAPYAHYRWIYWADSPLVQVEGEFYQSPVHAWPEHHFLEFRSQASTFTSFCTSKDDSLTPFEGRGKGYNSPGFGALLGPHLAVGLFLPSSNILIYDGDTFRYVHGYWREWSTSHLRLQSTLYLGPAVRPAEFATYDQALRAPLQTENFPAVDELAQQAKAHLEQSGDAPNRRLVQQVAEWRLASLKRQGYSLVRLSALQEAFAAAAKWYDQALAQSDTVVNGLLLAHDLLPGGVVLANSKSLLAFEKRRGEWGLSGLSDLTSGVDFAASSSGVGSFFKLELHTPLTKGPVVTANDAASQRLEIEDLRPSGALVLHLRFGDFKAESLPLDFLTAEVSIRVDAASPLASWSFKAGSPPAGLPFYTAWFPVLQGLKASTKTPTFVLVPEGWGRLLHKPERQEGFSARYPSHACTMQFMAYLASATGPALYFANHDGDANTKVLSSTPSPGGTLTLATELFPENMGSTRQIDWPYQVKIGPLAGGWYAAAREYRNWALQQKWCSAGPLSKRSDVPERVKRLAWWRQFASPERVTDSALQAEVELQRKVAAPEALHWYSWHKIPFDTDYPEYFPAKPGFAAGVRTLQQAGILVMPYINGRLWDKGSQSWQSENALRFACKHADGSPFIERYGSGRDLVPMCPTQSYWTDKLEGIVGNLMDKFGVDGVYIDQIGAAAPVWCMDPSHGHPLGGGHWWVDSYRKFLKSLRKHYKARFPAKFLTTESNAEPFIDCFDAYLMCNSTRNHLVPAFSVVYHDYILTFGRYFTAPSNRDVFFTQWGQLFVFGAQLGWFGHNLLAPQAADSLALVQNTAACREAALPWLALGEALPPPQLALTPGGALDVTWHLWHQDYPDVFPAVLSSAWRSPEGRLGIACVNVSHALQHVSLPLTPYFSDKAVPASVRLWLAGKWQTLPVETGRVEFDLPVRRSAFCDAGSLK